MKLRIPLLSTSLTLALLSGTVAMGYYGGGDLAGAAAATVTRGTLFATVGPNNAFTITLKKKNGKVVSQVKSGSWKIVVDDKSANHNFHLMGPGNVNMSTTRSEIVNRTWTVTLAVGTYNYKCDPHPTIMKGSFKVVAG